MARSIKTIVEQMDNTQAGIPELAGLTSKSATSIHGLWKHIVATQLWIQETLWDIFRSELEETIITAPVGSSKWLHDRVLKFQYDSVTPQVSELNPDDLSVQYPIIDETKRIITRASVFTSFNGEVTVKVAKNEPPEALTTTEIDSLKAYISDFGDGTYASKASGVGFAGVKYGATSLTADKLYLKGDIYYNGQYSATVLEDVKSTINDYLANLPFDGVVRVLNIIDAIQKLDYIKDVVFEEVAVRADTSSFSDRIKLVEDKRLTVPTYIPVAGYLNEESGVNDFETNLNFIVA